MGSRKRKRASGRKRSGAFLYPVLIVAALATLLLILRPWTLIPRSAPAASAPIPPPPPSSTELLVRLRTLLQDEAEWRRQGTGQPPEWSGKLRGEESMVHWNARVSAAIEAAGMQVREGTEELIERQGGGTLQRLTLEVGSGAETLATIVVETRRSPYLPPTF